jgi:hypothetical protein
MRYETLFPSRFIRSADFAGKDVTLVILKVFSEDIEDKSKAIMAFEGTKKQLVLCRTNAEACKLMWGPETDDWIGKRLTLYAAVIKDPFGDGEITATRVRGSPELERPLSAVVQRGRKTIKVAVQPTGQKKAAPAAAAKPANGNGKPARKMPPIIDECEPPPPGDEDAPGFAAEPEEPEAEEPEEPGVVMSFGSGKGKPLSELTPKDLKWYERVLAENVANPSKDRFRADNERKLSAVRRELGRR